jgi:hypothetical protein
VDVHMCFRVIRVFCACSCVSVTFRALLGEGRNRGCRLCLCVQIEGQIVCQLASLAHVSCQRMCLWVRTHIQR